MLGMLIPISRVDLRPVTSHDSSTSQDQNELAPPLNPEADSSHRRRTALFDILSLRHLREQGRNQSGNVAAGSVNASAEDVASSRDRRNRRISVRLSDVFTGRTRRERRDESPAHQVGPDRSEANATSDHAEQRP